MPTTFNMIGTHYWGRAEPHQDGSYITTEWVTLFIPIIPIKSLRLRPIGRLDSESEGFEVMEQASALNSKQVLHVYKGLIIFFLVFAVALYFLIEIGFNKNNAVGYIIFISTLIVSYFIFVFWVERFTNKVTKS